MDDQPTNKLSPKSSFLMGLATGFLVICTVGFFILLGLFLAKDKDGAQANVTSPSPSGTAPSQLADNPSQPSASISIRGLQPDDHIYGDLKAEATMVVFTDLECPFCKKFHPTAKQVVDNYPGKINLVYRNFPLEQLHSKASKEAEATECAAELGGNDGYWKFVDRLFEITPSNDGLDPAKLPEIAKEIGLDQKKFQDCYDSGKYADKVNAQSQEGIAAGAEGTPYGVILISGQKIPIPGAVPFEQIKATLDPLIQ
ncbi:MAG: DsbA family protein [bacterium]|nr:DsbA family protein [bacterium]